MQTTRKLLEKLTETFPPPPGRNHAIYLPKDPQPGLVIQIAGQDRPILLDEFDLSRSLDVLWDDIHFICRQWGGEFMPNLADLYTYSVIWSKEDGEFIGRCAEFPSLSWLAKTKALALAGIEEIVVTTIKDMERSGEAMPAPLF